MGTPYALQEGVAYSNAVKRAIVQLDRNRLATGSLKLILIAQQSFSSATVFTEHLLPMHYRLKSLHRRLKSLYLGLFLSSFIFCLCFGQLPFNGSLFTPNAKAGDATQLNQQGWERYQSGDVQGAIGQWETALSLTGNQPSALRATVLKYLVRAAQQVGEVDRSIAYLAQLIADYRQTGNTVQLGRMLTEQAQAYSSLGQQRKAIALLCGEVDHPCIADSALMIARQQADRSGEVAALGSLGNAYRLRGDYDRAIQHLETTLVLAKQADSPLHLLAALNGLGNTYVSLAERDVRRRQSAEAPEAHVWTQTIRRYDNQAIEYFNASLTVAHAQNDGLNELRSLLNLIVPLQRRQAEEAAVSGQQSANSGQQVAVSGQQSANSGQRSAVSGQNEKENQREGSKKQRDAVVSQQSLSFSLTPAIALQQAQTLLEQLPASREKAYAAIRLATLIQWVIGEATIDPATHCFKAGVPPQSVTWLQQAIAIAQQIRDPQAEAFALGRLGHVFECRQDYKQALALTQQAQVAAANHDNRYLWEWQAGRILRAQGKPMAAIAAYDLAVKTLQTIRGDLAVASRDFQFDFRDTVEPVYRELTALYLEQATGSTKQALQQPESKVPESKVPESKAIHEEMSLAASLRATESALETIDSLRLAELQNYLGEDCTLNAIAKPVTVVNPKTAVLSSIIFDKRVAVILTLPTSEPTSDRRVRSHVRWLPVSAQTVKATVNELRRRLEKRSDRADTYQEPSQQVYDWFIRPFTQDLQAAQIETLVFIQDGILRSIPMAALSDGNHFLVEQYAIASTLSLTLVDPLPLDRTALRVLGFGLTQPSQVEGPTFFAPLNYVKAEIDSIETALPGSKGLLDDAFTLDRLQQELTENAYPIVHLATHGRFGIDARDTFLVTGRRREERGERGEERGVRGEPKSTQHSTPKTQTYNEKLTMNALYEMIRAKRQGKPLELLTLTACETAVGSDRDALGIAGISLQAGARSTVASLWQVDDQATAQLVTHFYAALKQGMSRAKALQTAQTAWLQAHPGERHHPGYWAALILVGNWL